MTTKPPAATSQSVSIGLRILVLIAAAIFFIYGNWSSGLSTLLIALLMTAPSILERRYKVYIPLSLDLGVVAFIFVTLFLGQLGHFYDHIPYWDKFVHLQSGLLLGASGFRLVYSLQAREQPSVILSRLFIAIFAIAFSLAIGALWEMCEFFWDMALGRHSQASLSDTMWDLIADGVGGVIVSIYGYIWMQRYEHIPFTPDELESTY